MDILIKIANTDVNYVVTVRVFERYSYIEKLNKMPKSVSEGRAVMNILPFMAV
jgi:hypothetical protein